MTEYLVEMFIDGAKQSGVTTTTKPGVITLKLTKIETTAPVATVLGTKEIVVP